jgi:hypothetical protein
MKFNPEYKEPKIV